MDKITSGQIPRQVKNIVGDKFNRLTVVSFAGIQNGVNGNYALWNCLCECGTKSVVRGTALRFGGTKSCGCLQVEKVTKHGLWQHRLYKTWSCMIDRCTNPDNIGWKYYGGAGVRVCESWFVLTNFIKDMEPTFKEGLTLDRKNPFGNYEPDNCRWATDTQQANNRRTNYPVNELGLL